MSLEKIKTYIESLYENKKLNRKQYTAATELKQFGSVIDDDVARMLQVLITLTTPRKILEIGTSVGFSTVSMANMVKTYGGNITTIEFDAKVAEQAMKNFERERVAQQIEVKVGDAQKIVPNLTASYDLIFQDVGDKKLYAVLLDDCVKLLEPGGLLVAEDTLFPATLFSDLEWKKMKDSLAEFNKRVADCPLLESTLLPIGDGFTIAVKKN